MTRKHFELIAKALKESGANMLTIQALANALGETNPRFNRQRFITASKTWE